MDLPSRAIREIGFRLNARNIGDIVVEVCCEECVTLETLYFKSEIKNALDFTNFLLDDKTPKNKPIVEQEMYRQMYNNLMEMKVSKEQK